MSTPVEDSTPLPAAATIVGCLRRRPDLPRLDSLCLDIGSGTRVPRGRDLRHWFTRRRRAYRALGREGP